MLLLLLCFMFIKFKTENLIAKLQNSNQNFPFSWVSLIGFSTTWPEGATLLGWPKSIYYYINVLKTAFFDDFPKISDHFPKISENFSKLFRRPDERSRTFSENFQKFPKMSEDCRRLYNLRDKLDVSEIIDIFTCEDIISSHVRISYRFYQFVITRYTTDFYIIKINIPYIPLAGYDVIITSNLVLGASFVIYHERVLNINTQTYLLLEKAVWGPLLWAVQCLHKQSWHNKG